MTWATSMLGTRAGRIRTLAAATFAAAVTLTVACGPTDTRRSGSAPVGRDIQPKASHPVLEGTIGQIATFADVAGIPVEGYGVVGGLADTGGGDMPPAVRDILKEQLYMRGAGSARAGTSEFNPERLLSSRTVAAVEVRGRIPPMARRGTTFDLYLTALPGSQTTSLERGLLLSSDLKLIGLVENNLDTGMIATGEGPLYCKPDLEPTTTKPAPRNLRTAVVLAGGIVQADQPIRLQLFSPSYMRTSQIQRAVNSRWVDRFKPYASADGDTLVSLRVPPEFQSNPRSFIDLVTHLYLAQEVPGFVSRKARDLIAALEDPKAPHRELSLALQGLGRSILDESLRPAYISPNDTVRFYTARAGAMMLDSGAMVVLQEIAKNSQSRYRFEAINAISDSASLGETASATATLMNLLDTGDTNIRVTAYQGLVNMHSPAISSGMVGRNFCLDYVPGKGPPLIYATQSGQRRIALIGKAIFLPPGALYVSRDNVLTVNALETPDATDEAADTMTAPAAPTDKPATRPALDRKESVMLYYRSPTSGKTVNLRCANSLLAVIARLGYMPNPHAKDFNPNTPFIGATYQQIIEMLAAMSRDQGIPAEFVLEKAPEPILSPTEIMSGGRPEKRAATSPATEPAPDAPATIPDTYPTPIPEGKS